MSVPGMTQTCSKCARVNPPDAAFCFHDGNVLGAGGSRATQGGSSRPAFPAPFVFPSGRQCNTFDELALACQEEWDSARTLLNEGFFERFLGTVGRTDLAMAARSSSSSPDRDRGLDQLLGLIPCDALQAPRLHVEPGDLNLGSLQPGVDRRFDLSLNNRGMRLLCGSISCENCDWLALGEAPGAPEKLFQFSDELLIPVLIRGRRLRAGNRPLEAKIVVESNGGSTTVIVRADVPAQAFPEGPLKGAKTPRQIAEKARAAREEAAPFFENGSVAQWYVSNGWTYPVQGPTSTGLGALQQFFEALGLIPAPTVSVSAREILLSGEVGSQLSHALEVRTEEKRHVYAHATSNQGWLEVGRVRLNGRTAIIPLVVPRVPDREGETLVAKLLIHANGNQKFEIPVCLEVGGNLVFAPEPALPRPVALKAPPVALPAGPVTKEKWGARWWVHSFPVGILVLSLLAILYRDLRSVSQGGEKSSTRSIYEGAFDTEPRLGVNFDAENRFGLVMLKERDPANPDKKKRLTFEENGGTNNTCVKVDGSEYLFGDPGHGRWVRRRTNLPDRHGWEAVFEFRDDVQVTQRVELLMGEQTRLVDTCRVLYTIENRATTPRKVGLRALLDTYIGTNDGVPFVVPGQSELVQTVVLFPQKDIPDYVQALEYPDLANPGTVAHLGLKLPECEPMHSLLIGGYPGNKRIRWDVPKRPMNENPEKKDSAVTMFWAYEPMNAGETRRLGFTYGLNTIASTDTGAGKLGLTVGGDFRPGKEFTATAYIREASANQVVRLRLPQGFSLSSGQEPEVRVEAGGDIAQVSWRVRAGVAGDHTLEAESGGTRTSLRVAIREKSLY